MDKMIFHISRPYWSDKTYLENKLVVINIDDLRNKFIKKEYGENLMFVDINFSKRTINRT